MEDDHAISSRDEGSSSSSASNCSSSSSDESADESSVQIKRYKLYLHPNYNESDVCGRTHTKWKNKLEEYTKSQTTTNSSSAVGAPITVNELKEDSHFYSEDSSTATVDNYQHDPSINKENIISHDNETNVNTDCTGNKKVFDDKYLSQNSSPRSSIIEKRQRTDVPLPDAIRESADMVQKGIGSIEDHYPFQFQCTNNGDESSSALPKDNNVEEEEEEEEEEELCRGVESGSSESESEAESLDDDELLNEKNQIFFNKIMFAESQLNVRDVIVLLTAFSLDSKLDDVHKVKLGELITVLAGKQFSNVNLSKYMMNKCFSSQEENVVYHFYCTECTKQILFSVEADKKKRYKEGVCDGCRKKQQITNASSNYFLSMDVKYQIELLLSNPEIKNDIIDNLKKREMRSNSNVYEDVYSGSIHKSMTRSSNKSEYILTVNGSTDGAPLTKSGKTGFWPVQLTINDLVPEIEIPKCLTLWLTFNQH